MARGQTWPEVIYSGESNGTLTLTLQNHAETDTAVLLGIGLTNLRWYLPREVIVEVKRQGRLDSEELVSGADERRRANRSLGCRPTHAICFHACPTRQ